MSEIPEEGTDQRHGAAVQLSEPAVCRNIYARKLKDKQNTPAPLTCIDRILCPSAVPPVSESHNKRLSTATKHLVGNTTTKKQHAEHFLKFLFLFV